MSERYSYRATARIERTDNITPNPSLKISQEG